MEKCDALTQDGSPFKGKMQPFALAVFVCYECEKCTNPYVAGRIRPKHTSKQEKLTFLEPLKPNVKDSKPGENEAYQSLITSFPIQQICKSCSGVEKC